MKLTNLIIKDLITPEAKLTFLVGAGCSVDPPSCLPAGRAMMKALIEYTCAKSEIKTILNLKNLRFEQLIEILRNELDHDLKIIDFYGLCDKPNLQHFFLAEMIMNGQFVITTNFDFLIEYSLFQTEIPKEMILPVITSEDYKKYEDPNEMIKQGKKVIYKIHGSTKNIITDENTRDSLIATIQAFGANKEGENVFQLEPFKQPAFINLTKGRSLVVMGYSGSDDFDIVPTLKALDQVQDIIWINYVPNDEGNEKIYEIEMVDSKDYDNLIKVDQILVDIKRMNYVNRVLRVDINTTRMVRDLFTTQAKIRSTPFSIDPYNWFQDILKKPNNISKYHIPRKIYYELGIVDKILHCSKKILKLARKSLQKSWEASALNNIGWYHQVKGNYSKALKFYEEALQINKQVRNLREIPTCLNNIGVIYFLQGYYLKALEQYGGSLKIIERLGDLKRKAIILNNIGDIYRYQSDFPEALNRYEKALQIDEELGNISGKARDLDKIGEIYFLQGKYSKATQRYEEAFQITEKLGDIKRKSSILLSIGNIFKKQGNYTKALKYFEEALSISEKLGDLGAKIGHLNSIGLIYCLLGNYLKALKFYEESLQISENLGDISGKAALLNNFGEIFLIQEKNSMALERFEEALQIDEELKNLHGKAISLNNIGLVYKNMKNYPEALQKFKRALRLAEKMGEKSLEASLLNNIAFIYQNNENYPKALKLYEQSLRISTQLGDVKTEANLLQNIGSMSFGEGNYSKALTYFRESMDILEQLDEPLTIAHSYWWIGATYNELNEPSKALKNLKCALEFYEQLGLENLSQNVRDAISDLKIQKIE